MVRRLFATALLACTLSAALPAAEDVRLPPSTEPAGSLHVPLLSRLNSILDGDFPQLDIPGTFKLILRPHFGDLVRRDYMRTETGLRWALNDRFDITSEASVFYTTGLKQSAGYGIGRLRLGTRYLLDETPAHGYDTSLTLNLEAPVGHPPVDMTDGHYHLTPGVIVQRQSPRNPKLSTFAGLGFDFIDPSSIPGRFGFNQPHDDSVNATVGVIYDLGQLKYVLSTTYATTALVGSRAQDYFYVQPSLQWYVPRRLTFNSKTQWIAGLGARATWGPDGFEFGLNSRVRAEITFRQVLEKMRLRSPAKSP